MIRLQVLTIATGKGLKGGSSSLLKINTRCRTAPVWDGGESRLCCPSHKAWSPLLTTRRNARGKAGRANSILGQRVWESPASQHGARAILSAVRRRRAASCFPALLSEQHCSAWSSQEGRQ